MDQKSQFVAKLNKALEMEYGAAVQYIQHAAVITGAQYEAIAKELVVHASEEIGHAVKVSVIIVDLDGVPSVDVEKRLISNEAVVMLEQDLSGEQAAIAIYKELVIMANEMGESGIRLVLEEILSNEEEHARDLLGALGR